MGTAATAGGRSGCTTGSRTHNREIHHEGQGRPFILGAAVGYMLGTRAGREQFEKIMASAKSALELSAVKAQVTPAESAISADVREQGPKVTDQREPRRSAPPWCRA